MLPVFGSRVVQIVPDAPPVTDRTTDARVSERVRVRVSRIPDNNGPPSRGASAVSQIYNRLEPLDYHIRY
jgi:hypothetical protein